MVVSKVTALAVAVALFCCCTVQAVVEVSSSEQLLAVLGTVEDFETITIQPGSYSGLCGIELSKSLTLVGIDLVELDCESQGSQIQVSGAGVRVVLDNLAFVNGHTLTDGGCLSVSEGADIEITKCSFSQCSADNRGGALAALNAGKVQISDSTFTLCDAFHGGAVSIKDPSASASIDGCEFRNNSATGNGGGILLESAAIDINGDAVFLGNMAQNGGGIAALTSVNSTNASAVHIDGAARFLENVGVSVDVTVFTSGGAIHLVDGSSLISTGASYIGNVAQFGGVINLQASTALVAGGVMDHNDGTVSAGCILATQGASVVLRDGISLSHNFALFAGGGVYGEGGVLIHAENGVRMADNVAAGGGAIGGLAALIRLWDGVDFDRNHGTLTGGAFYLHLLNTVETRGRVRFHGNTANTDGGAIYLYTDNTATFTKGTTMDGNVCLGRGGAMVLFQGSKLIADQAEFTENDASALSCHDCELKLSGCRFARNVADAGGGLHWKGTGECKGSHFEENVAENGGAVAHFSETAVTLDGNTFYNNTASKDGGCVAGLEASVMHLSNSSFELCAANNNGAAIVVKDEASMFLSAITMTRGTAGGTGGGAHHQGKLLHIEEGAVVTAEANSARGGGGVSSASTLTVGGQLRVLDNFAHADGGGVQGFGFLSVTTVLEGGWLEVVGNEAAANGGGLALRDNARLWFSPSPCPATCSGVGDGYCDSACLLPQCRWAGGDCDGRLLNAGEQAVKPCNRDPEGELLCNVISVYQDQCRPECFDASCDWGIESCAAEARAVGECPYNSALIYKSLTANPDVVYVTEGGTAQGYGRCESGTCSPADATIGREEPYCTTVNDNGRMVVLACEGCSGEMDLGPSWGPCSSPDKPRLPHIAFDYDPDELVAVLDMDAPTLLRQYPACGYQPLAIRSNRAGLAGGGVYKDGCNGFLESVGRCFVGELENARLPTVVFDIADNHAGGPGGGIFVECGEMGACLTVLAADSGLPDEGRAVGKMMHFGDGSAAEAYGAEAAGLPVELELMHQPRNATPGQTVIDVGFRLVDSRGQVVRGSSSWPNPHVVEVAVCRVGEACTAAAALQEPFLLRSHPTDEVTATLRAQEAVARCPAGDPRVEIHVRATGGSGERLHKSVEVACEPCGPGQEKMSEGDGDAEVWTCRSCLPSQYVVSAEGGCQPCPLEGAECDGRSLTPTVTGATWAAEEAVMRLQTCPTGYILVRDPAVPVLDSCVKCPPGTFSVSAAAFPDTLTVARAAEAPLLCASCVRGATCLGGADIIAQAGFWQDMALREGRRAEASSDDVKLYQCPPGLCEGNNSCTEGSHGPVCGLCEEGWGRQALSCVHCGDSALGQARYIPSFVATIVCCFIFIYILTWRPLCEEMEGKVRAKLCCCCPPDDGEGPAAVGAADTPPTRLHALKRHFMSIQWTSPTMIGAFKVAVSFFQVASTFPITFRIDWPDSFGLISSLGRLTGLDISLLLPTVACVSSQYDYFETLLLFTTAFPITITIILCFPYLLTRLLGSMYHGGSTAHPKHDRMQQHCLRAVLLWFFLIYPTVSEQTLSTFFCQDLGSGGHVLVLDKSVHCPWGGSSPAGGFYFALFLVLLFPIGIPVFFYNVVTVFFVPAMAEAKSNRALFSELIKLYRAETSTPISVKLAQHVGMAPGGDDEPSSPSPMARRPASRLATRTNSEGSETVVPLQAFKRRVSQLFTQTFVQRELSGVAPETTLHDKLQHVLGHFGCSAEELARMVTVLQRLSINTGQGEGLDAFEQLALKVAKNHFLFTGHETLEELSLEQLQALFLFDWEGLNRKRSEREIRKRKARRQQLMRRMDCDELRRWVFAKAKELEKSARITVPAVNWNGETPEEERALGFVGFLFDDFRVQTWRFFLIGELCKLIMTSVLVFIPGRFSQQLAWGFFVQVCITAMYTVYQPMAEPWLNHFQVYAMTVQCAILFFGLILSTSDRDDPAQQRALDHWAIFIVCLKWTLVLYPLTAHLISKTITSLQVTLRRLVLGTDADSEEREPTCLERVLFPTTANERLRRLSTQSERHLRLNSVSDAELLGMDFNPGTPTPMTPMGGASSPVTRRHLRAPSSVDAQLGLETPRPRPAPQQVEATTPTITNGTSTQTTAAAAAAAAAELSQDTTPTQQPLETGQKGGPEPRPPPIAQDDSETADKEDSSGSGGDVEDGVTRPSPTQDSPFLIMSMTPTPRK